MHVIKRNKNVHQRLILMLCLSLFIVGRYAYNNFFSEVEWRNYVAYLLTVLFFFLVALLIHSVTEYLKPAEAMTLSEDGFNDRVSFSEVGFVPWDQIEKVFIDKMRGNDHLIIQFKNDFKPEITSSALKRTLVSQIREKFGNAIAVNKDYVTTDLGEILEMIEKMRVS